MEDENGAKKSVACVTAALAVCVQSDKGVFGFYSVESHVYAICVQPFQAFEICTRIRSAPECTFHSTFVWNVKNRKFSQKTKLCTASTSERSRDMGNDFSHINLMQNNHVSNTHTHTCARTTKLTSKDYWRRRARTRNDVVFNGAISSRAVRQSKTVNKQEAKLNEKCRAQIFAAAIIAVGAECRGRDRLRCEIEFECPTKR